MQVESVDSYVLKVETPRFLADFLILSSLRGPLDFRATYYWPKETTG
jgi:hypothetical protein